MTHFLKKHWSIFLVFFLILAFYSPVFLKGLIPSPLDSMVGLYHPFRDYYSNNYPNGIPFKNFLITDPFRQLLVWKELTIFDLRHFTMPLWNPYEMSGKPLMGNFQSGVFYPFNAFFIFFNFLTAWSFGIMLQQFLGAFFMYLYLNVLKRSNFSKIVGLTAFVFSGFYIAWLEWGNVLHAYVWLPLGLFAVEKITKNQKILKGIVFPSAILGLIFSISLFAGHPQTTLYSIACILAYMIFVLAIGTIRKISIIVGSLFFFTLFSSVQLYQGVVFLLHSLRGTDQLYAQVEGWFVPFQNLVQFVAPDFFGNPATLNYWGIFNYAEFIGYVGIVSLIFVFLAAALKKDKRDIVLIGVILTCLLLMTKNPISQIPYKMSVPFLSNMQPTRLIGIVAFCLAVLSSSGAELFQNNKKIKSILIPIGVVGLSVVFLWIIVLINPFSVEPQNILVAKRNSILPSAIFMLSLFTMLSYVYVIRRNKKDYAKNVVLAFLILLLFFDMFRFARKFTPFALREYYYPQTKTITFLQKNIDAGRVLIHDDRILAPNILTHYKIQSVSGYDPLYLKNYAQFIVASERGSFDITPPYGFNRIINPKRFDTPLINLLGVKYVLSIEDITSPTMRKVFEEGSTKVFENTLALPRAFFVDDIISVRDKNEVLKNLFVKDLSKSAILVGGDYPSTMVPLSMGIVSDFTVNAGKTSLKTQNSGDGFLVVSDVYYPLMQVFIDGKKEKLYEVDYALRGVYIPKGKHEIEFRMRLL